MEKIHLVFPEKIGTISPRLYGAFIEHLGSVVYDGIYCGEDSSVEHVRRQDDPSPGCRGLCYRSCHSLKSKAPDL